MLPSAHDRQVLGRQSWIANMGIVRLSSQSGQKLGSVAPLFLADTHTSVCLFRPNSTHWSVWSGPYLQFGLFNFVKKPLNFLSSAEKFYQESYL